MSDDDEMLCGVCGAQIIDEGPLTGECVNETPCRVCYRPHHDRGDGVCASCHADHDE